MSVIQGIPSYYSVRFLLGVAEAGFFPGVVYYLVQWFPDANRARIISIFMVGQPASSAIGGPISTYILAHADGALGLQGWQWLFVLEGLPAILFGLCCFWVMTDRPALAGWLHADERTVLQRTVDRDRERAEGVRKYGVLDGLANIRVVLLCLVFYLVVTSIYGSVFWVPQIVNTFGVSTVAVGFIVAIPYLAASIISVLWSFHSDRTGERFWHVAIPAFTSGVGFLIAATWSGHPVVTVIGLSAACVGMYSVLPVFWTLPTSFLTGRAVAGAVAFITSFGNLSGIFTPPVVGWIRQTTGGFSAAMYGMACTCLAAGLLTFVCRSVHRGRAASVPA
jgi:ACS family tartrate transporter-like MFS transporter